MEMVVICPGSFNPITNSYLDIISRSSRLFEKIYVVVVNNETQQPLFTVEERVNLLKEVTRDFSNVIVDSYSGLIVDYARKVKANAIIKGLWEASNFEFETQITFMSSLLNHELETIYIMSRNKHLILNTSILKEAINNRADISQLVPKVVEYALKKKFLIKEFPI